MTRHVWINPRLATIKGVGIGYDMNASKLTDTTYQENEEPPKNTNNYSNVLSKAYKNLSSDYSFYTATQLVPDNSDAKPLATILTKDSTTTQVPQIAKRKGDPPSSETQTQRRHHHRPKRK